MRVVVFGYHNIGHACLTELVRQGHEVLAVVTHEDDPNEEIWFQSVPALARELNLPTLTPDDPNTPEFVAQIAAFQPDIMFSFYYRHMLKQPMLDLSPRGFLNLHGSYLPYYRGRCPVNWVLVNGETETGVTLHYMVAKPDAGDIVAQRRVPIDFEDTAFTLYGKLTEAAAALFAEALPLLAAGTAPRLAQDHSQSSYYGGRKPADGHFDWSWPAVRIYNLVRAVTHPYPGAFTEFRGQELLVWSCWPADTGEEGCGLADDYEPGTILSLLDEGPLVAAGQGVLLLETVQLAGEPEQPGAEFARAHGLSVGDQLT
jgi:methionyl-tRNA formyltransferase